MAAELTKLYKAAIIMREQTLLQSQNPDKYNYRFLDRVQVKGKT